MPPAVTLQASSLLHTRANTTPYPFQRQNPPTRSLRSAQAKAHSPFILVRAVLRRLPAQIPSIYGLPASSRALYFSVTPVRLNVESVRQRNHPSTTAPEEVTPAVFAQGVPAARVVQDGIHIEVVIVSPGAPRADERHSLWAAERVLAFSIGFDARGPPDAAS